MQEPEQYYLFLIIKHLMNDYSIVQQDLNE